MHHSRRGINEPPDHIRRSEAIGDVSVDISTTPSHRHRRTDFPTPQSPRIVRRHPDPDLDSDDPYRRRPSRPSSRTDSLGVGNPTARHDRRIGRPRETRQLNHDTRRMQCIDYSNERSPRRPQHHIRADKLEIRDNYDRDRRPHREHRKKHDKEFTHSKENEKSSKRSKNDAVPDLHASSSASPRGETDEQSSNVAKKEGKAWKASGLTPLVEENEDDEDEGAYGNPLNTFGGAIESGDEEEESLISQQPKSNEGKTKNEEADLDRKPASNEKGSEGKKTSLLGMFKRLKTPSSSK